MKRVAVLGSTGSVGQQALQLIAERGERFQVSTLTAHRSGAELAAQIEQFRPAAACLVEGAAATAPPPPATAWCTGADGIIEALEASRPHLVLNAITGAAGLPASEWAVREGVPLALANKESLVMAGPYLTAMAAERGTPILPVDSEHCAIFQCLRGEDPSKVRRLWITGSGGPFRQRPLETFDAITPAEALKHPTWVMGPRITVGSATMMNKAFEIVEAHWLFGVAPEQIEVVLHPQSIVHSMVEFVDGNIMAQLGVPDMRVPILFCLGYPERQPFAFEPLDLARFRSLTFEAVDPERFPAIPLAYETLAAGGDSGAVLNAADEVMTGLFLEGKATFPAITATVAAVLRTRDPRSIHALGDVQEADREARQLALRHATSAPQSP
ncbi:MAG: 1-deoxy-D-xylulose-5-phosphate reductoisomerase [Planctomycetota bacterium]